MTTLHDLKVSWDDLWILLFGLSQFHGHGSSLMCEVALPVGDPPWTKMPHGFSRKNLERTMF